MNNFDPQGLAGKNYNVILKAIQFLQKTKDKYNTIEKNVSIIKKNADMIDFYMKLEPNEKLEKMLLQGYQGLIDKINALADLPDEYKFAALPGILERLETIKKGIEKDVTLCPNNKKELKYEKSFNLFEYILQLLGMQ